MHIGSGRLTGAGAREGVATSFKFSNPATRYPDSVVVTCDEAFEFDLNALKWGSFASYQVQSWVGFHPKNEPLGQLHSPGDSTGSENLFTLEISVLCILLRLDHPVS